MEAFYVLCIRVYLFCLSGQGMYFADIHRMRPCKNIISTI